MYKSAFISLFLMSNYILGLSLSNKLSFYVHKRYVLMITISAIFCLLVLLCIFIFRKRIHIHDSFKKTDLVVIAIIILAIIIPAKPLTSITAAQRSQNNGAPKIDIQKIIENNTPIEENVNETKEIKTEITKKADVSQIEEIEAIGFVSTGEIFSEKENPEEFYITRFVVACCTADATPMGLKVKYKWQDKFKKDDWLKIQGIINTITTQEGKTEFVLIPSSIIPIPTPEDPYLY